MRSRAAALPVAALPVAASPAASLPAAAVSVVLAVTLVLSLLAVPAAAVPGELQVLTRDSTAAYGGEAWGITDDGRFILSWTPMEWDPQAAPDDGIEDLYIYDRGTETWHWVSRPLGPEDDRNAFVPGGSISTDGSTVAYSYLPDVSSGVFVLVIVDVETGAQEVHPNTEDAAAFLSRDGRFVAFDQIVPDCDCSRATVIDRDAGTSTIVGPEGSQVGAVSDDGSVLSYRVDRGDGSADWFLVDVATFASRPVVAPDGVVLVDGRSLHDGDGRTLFVPGVAGQSVAIHAISTADGSSSVAVGGLPQPAPVLNDASVDGSLLTFTTASALLPDDTNDQVDAYAYDRTDQAFIRLNTRPDGSQSADRVQDVGVFVPADPTFAIFTSSARDLVDGPLPPLFNLFIKGINGPIPPVLADESVDMALLDGDPATTERVDVDAPAQAALAFSSARFADGSAPYAVLSRDDAFADSLAGTVLAGGPMLLTPTAALTADVAEELRRVLPAGSVVYLLGGTAALLMAVEQSVADLGLMPRRLSGTSRIETALAVADEAVSLFGAGGVAGLARSDAPAENPTAAWADSVTGGVLSARDGVPTLLTAGDTLHPATAAWLRDNGVTSTRVFGGTAAVSDDVLAAVPGGERIAGSTRAGTAAAIAGRIGEGSGQFVIVNGFADDGWAYGLPAAGYAAFGLDSGPAPILLVGDTVPPETADLVGSCGEPIVDLLLVGGFARISAEVADGLDALDGGFCG